MQSNFSKIAILLPSGCLFILLLVNCQNITIIKGNITDNSAHPIENASVMLIPESIESISTKNGNFKLSFDKPNSNHYTTLKISADSFLDKYLALDTIVSDLQEITLIKKAELADKILEDHNLNLVREMALELLSSSNVNAGGGYPEIWIRDLNTFVEAFLAAGDSANQASTIKNTILKFMYGQDKNYFADDGLPENAEGSIADQYNGEVYKKISVETDQESSLILTVGKYIQITGDSGILRTNINGLSVIQRMEKALNFLYKERWATEYGLLFGAVTVDWGDISPDVNNGIGANLRPGQSHIAVDVYDNAMFLLAMQSFISLLEENSLKKAKWSLKLEELKKNIMHHLWDNKNMKFYAHLYLKDASPYVSGTPWEKMKVDNFIDGTPFNEDKIYFHGGTGIAILTGLLDPVQIAWSIKRMRQNVQKSTSQSIGLTVYPPYPQNIWTSDYTKSRIGAQAYYYQNGGDWTWFGARTIIGFVENDFVEEAYQEIQPMLKRVIANNGFYEWWHPLSQGGKPVGNGDFRGSAGVLYSAIETLYKWARENCSGKQKMMNN